MKLKFIALPAGDWRLHMANSIGIGSRQQAVGFQMAGPKALGQELLLFEAIMSRQVESQCLHRLTVSLGEAAPIGLLGNDGENLLELFI